MSHDDSFDQLVSNQVFSVRWRRHHAYALSQNAADVCPLVRNGSGSPQWWGALWRWQDTVHRCFVNSTEVVFAAIPLCSTIEVTCNQVNFLRNHDGKKSEDELLGNAFLFGVNVADM